MARKEKESRSNAIRRSRYRLYRLKQWLTLHPVDRTKIKNAETLQKNLAATSSHLNNLLLFLVGYCVFCFMILGRPDFELFEQRESVKIPFAEVQVSFLAFLWLGPLFLLGISIYLHSFQLHLLELKRNPLYPATPKPPFIFNLRLSYSRSITHLLFYWLVPFILVLFIYKSLAWPDNEWGLRICITGILFHLFLNFTNNHSKKFHHILVPLILFGTIAAGTLFVMVFSFFSYRIEFRRPFDFKNLETKADFNGKFLALADLLGARFETNDFSAANLAYARLNDAAFLPYFPPDRELADVVNLSGARLDGAELTGARFIMANLRKARIRHAWIHNADFSHADLEGARLQGSDVKRGSFREANLKGANFSAAELEAVDVTDANFEEAVFCNTTLTDVKGIKKANFKNALFYGVKYLNSDDPNEDFPRLARKIGAKFLSSKDLKKKLATDPDTAKKCEFDPNAARPGEFYPAEYFQYRCNHQRLWGDYFFKYITIRKQFSKEELEARQDPDIETPVPEATAGSPERKPEVNETAPAPARDATHHSHRLLIPYPFLFSGQEHARHCRAN